MWKISCAGCADELGTPRLPVLREPFWAPQSHCLDASAWESGRVVRSEKQHQDRNQDERRDGLVIHTRPPQVAPFDAAHEPAVRSELSRCPAEGSSRTVYLQMNITHKMVCFAFRIYIYSLIYQ
jgi:hypothetical protein